MRALTPTTLDGTDRLSCHLHFEHDVKASAARTFDILARGENQRDWASGYRSTRWYGDERREGTVRDIHMAWITVRERFLCWQPAARFAFTCDAMSIQLASALLEDITFVADGPTTSRLVWDVHFTPTKLLARAVGSRRLENRFRPLFGGFAAGLARYAGENPTPRT